MDEIKLSIILVTHNRPGLLKRCINAIQPILNDQRFEIIVVDDLGLKETFTVVSEYQCSNLSYISRKDKPSLARSRNYGIAFSRGKLITFCDDDDTLELNWLYWIVENVQQEDDKFYIGNYQRVVEDRVVGIEINRTNFQFSEKNLIQFMVVNQFPVGTYVIPNSFCKAKSFDEDMQTHEDWEFLFATITKLKTQFVNLQACTIYDDKNKENQMTNYRRKYFKQDFETIYERYKINDTKVIEARKSFINNL